MMVADLSTPPGRVMLDTNVLLSATDALRHGHKQALQVLGQWPDSGTALFLSPQVVREYLTVATRPVDCNGLGMPVSVALDNVRLLCKRTALLVEDDVVCKRLLGLLADVECAGRQIHDANIVATMLVHKVPMVVTMNLRDFSRFGAFVSAISL
jgi:predicted nucleic acid-binding protein